jgi:hypothetical protein
MASHARRVAIAWTLPEFRAGYVIKLSLSHQKNDKGERCSGISQLFIVQGIEYRHILCGFGYHCAFQSRLRSVLTKRITSRSNKHAIFHLQGSL